jgi:hypothetical protein
MRRWLIAVGFLAACSGAKTPSATSNAPQKRTTTSAALEALPVLPIAEGQLVCLADGISPCPGGIATANWLTGGRYATWELRSPVTIWTPGKTDPQILGEIGSKDEQYNTVFSVAATRTGYIVLNVNPPKALLYNSSGVFSAMLPTPQITVTRTRAYSGSVPFFQAINSGGNDSAARFDVRLIDGPGDTIGIPVLHESLPWLILRDNRPVVPLPLFPTLPSYAFAPDSDIVWSPGNIFQFERRSPTGVVRWSVSSDVHGPVLDSAEIAQLRSKLPADEPARRASFDSSLKHSDKYLPAITGISLAPDGRVLVIGPQAQTRDSVPYYVLSSSGEPIGRFAMPRRSRPLLFAGDSVLVQRPGANAHAELRWIHVTAGARH